MFLAMAIVEITAEICQLHFARFNHAAATHESVHTAALHGASKSVLISAIASAMLMCTFVARMPHEMSSFIGNRHVVASRVARPVDTTRPFIFSMLAAACEKFEGPSCASWHSARSASPTLKIG